MCARARVWVCVCVHARKSVSVFVLRVCFPNNIFWTAQVWYDGTFIITKRSRCHSLKMIGLRHYMFKVKMNSQFREIHVCVRACVRDWLMIAYIALFSALLSRLTALACDSTRVTSFFFSAFFWISTEVVYLQRWHGWCHMKLQPSRRNFCVHHTTNLRISSCMVVEH